MIQVHTCVSVHCDQCGHILGLPERAWHFRTEGAAINALKDEVTEALASRRAVLKAAALAARLRAEALDVTLTVRPDGGRRGCGTA